MLEDCIYLVHSKVDEALVGAQFDIAAEAIAYAKEKKDYQTSVEAVEVVKNDFGEVIEEGKHEVIWSYDLDQPQEQSPEAKAADDAELDAALAKADEDDKTVDPYEADEFEVHVPEGSKVKVVTDKPLTEDSDPVKNEQHIIDTTKPVADASKELHDVCDPKMSNLQPDGIKDKLEDPSAEHKDVTEGINYDELREKLEANEDEVECQECFGTFPKNECVYHEDKHGYVCKDCESKLNEAKDDADEDEDEEEKKTADAALEILKKTFDIDFNDDDGSVSISVAGEDEDKSAVTAPLPAKDYDAMKAEFGDDDDDKSKADDEPQNDDDDDADGKEDNNDAENGDDKDDAVDEAFNLSF
jgi:hypothetical protein